MDISLISLGNGVECYLFCPKRAEANFVPSRIVNIFNGGLDYCIDVGVVELTASITFLKKFTTVVKEILDLLS